MTIDNLLKNTFENKRLTRIGRNKTNLLIKKVKFSCIRPEIILQSDNGKQFVLPWNCDFETEESGA